jgi:hypothetical protein
MKNEESNKNTRRFCQIAVDMGFITEEQKKEALYEQISNDPSTRLRPQRLVGEILLKKGWLTNKQVETVLVKIQSQ